jgi:hypothetical protein
MTPDEEREYAAIGTATRAAFSALLARLAADREDGGAFVEDVWKLAVERIAALQDSDPVQHRITAGYLAAMIDAAEADIPDAASLIEAREPTRHRRRRLPRAARSRVGKE